MAQIQRGEHHGREYLLTAAGLLVELVAVVCGEYGLALGAALFFWLAALSYGNPLIAHWKPYNRHSARIGAALLITAIMCLLPFAKEHLGRKGDSLSTQTAAAASQSAPTTRPQQTAPTSETPQQGTEKRQQKPESAVKEEKGAGHVAPAEGATSQRGEPLIKCSGNCTDVNIHDNELNPGHNKIDTLFANSGKAEGVRLERNVINKAPSQGQAVIFENRAGGEAKDVTATNNKVMQTAPGEAESTNSIVHNAGKITSLQISDSSVSASQGGTGTVVNNLPGGEIDQAKIDHAKVSTEPSAQQATRTPSIIYMKNVENAHLGGIICGLNNDFLKAVGPNSKVSIENLKINDPKTCSWVFFLGQARKHQADLDAFLAGWQRKQESSWESLPAELRREYTNELQDIRTKLLAASKDDNSFDSVTKELMANPPSFDVTQP